jgi:fibronectin-binding autotransporter adhesin
MKPKYVNPLIFRLSLVTAVFSAPVLLAAPLYKVSNDDNLAEVSSWSTDGAFISPPDSLTAADTWYFNEVRMQGARTVELGSDLTIAGMALDYAVAASPNDLVISAGHTLTLNGGSLGGQGVIGANYTTSGIVLNRGVGGSLTIDADVALGASQSWVQGRTGTGITVNGAISLGANNLTFNVASSGTATLGGEIDGSGKITKFGSGTLVLPVANHFTGGFQLGPDAGAGNTGVVLVGNADSFGTGGVVSRGAQLRSSVADLSLPNPFAVGAGGLRFGGVNNFTLAGTVTLDAASRSVVNHGTATVTLAGGIDTVAGSVAAFDSSAGKIIVNGPITGAGGVNVSAGDIAFNGANTYTGTTVVSGGRISGTGTLPTNLAMSGGTLALGGGTTTAGLTLAQGATFTNTPTVVFNAPPVAGTTYDLFNYSGTVAGAANLKVANRGTITDTGSKYTFVLGAPNQTRTWSADAGTWDASGTNALWVEGDQKFYNGDAAIFNEPSAASVITLSGTISATGFSINNTTNAYTFSGGAITGSTGLIKTGSGAMSLTAGHTFTGDVLVSGGTVTGTGGVPSANTNSSFGLKSGSRTITSQGAGTAIWLNATNGSSNSFGGGGMTAAQIPTLIAKNGGAIHTGRFNTIGNVILENGGHLTGSSTETSANYGGYQFVGNVTVTGSGAGSFIDLNNSTRPNHLLGAQSTTFEVANVTGDAAADLTVSASLANGSGDYPGTGSLVKTGAGRMILSGANTYSGSTTVTAGTLELSGSLVSAEGLTISSGATFAVTGAGQLGAQGSYSGEITNAGTVIFSGSATQTLTSPITGEGGLTKSGSGVLHLGYHNYTGPTLVSGGTLRVDGELNPESSITVTQGGALGGLGIAAGDVEITGGTVLGGNPNGYTFTVGSLRFPTTGSIQIAFLDQYTLWPAIEVRDGLVASGGANSITVNLPTGPLAAGDYRLIEFDSAQAVASNFVLGSVPTLGSRQAGSLVINGNFLIYRVTGINPTWTGLASGEWSTGVLGAPKNWFTTVASDYVDGDAVTFDDGALGSTTLTLPSVVTPTSVLFNNSSLPYSVSGAGGIAGATTALTKSGNGLVTLNTVNTYGGSTTITGGTLALGAGATIGGGDITLSEATLALTSQVLANNIKTDSGILGGASATLNGVISGDALNVNTTGLLRLTGVNTYTGPTNIISGGFEISGAGQLNNGAYAGAISNGGALRFNTSSDQILSGGISGIGSLTKNNTGKLTLAAKSTHTGNTTVNGGILELSGGGGASGTIRGSVTVNAGASLRLSTGDATGYAGDAGSLTSITLDGGNLDNNMDARIAGGNQTLGNAGVTMIGGSITGVPGSNLDFFAGSSRVITLASSKTSTISGTALDLRQGGGVTFTVAQGTTPSGVDLEISSMLTNQGPAATGPGTGANYGSNPLNKAGDGVMKLTGDSNYSGNTNVNGGTLDVTAGNLYIGALQNAAVVTVNSGGLLRVLSLGYNVDPLSNASLGGLRGAADARVLNGGTLEVTSATETVSNNFTVAAAGGTFRYRPANTADVLTLEGNSESNIVVNGTATVDTVGNVTIQETIEGTGGLTKTGDSVLTLSGSNTYTGATTIEAGTLATNGAAIPDAGSLVIHGGRVNVTGIEVVNTLFIGGVQQAAGTWGSTASGATHKNDTYFSGTGVVSVTSGAGTGGYSSWADANAGGGNASGDFDNDGVPNGIEYFLGTTGSSFTPNPGVVGGKVTWTNGGNIPSSAYGTQFVVQTSSNLSVWTDVQPGDPNLSNTAGSLQYTIPSAAGKVFIRLLVTPN